MLKFLFVGIGQCGNKFANSFAEHGNVAVAINTTEKDMNDLEHIGKHNLLTITASGTKGGAGKNPAVGKRAMEEHMDEVVSLIDSVQEGTDFLFLWAGLGGGTGSGALPALLKHLLEEKKRKIILGLTLPDESEGVEVQINAMNSLLEILKMIQTQKVPCLLIDNNKIRAQMARSDNFDWRNVNYMLSKTFSQFNQSANLNSKYETFDESDFQKAIWISGLMSVVKVQLKDKDITTSDTLKNEVLKELKDNNYFVDYDYTTAKIISTVIEAPESFLRNKSQYKLLESSLQKLRDACGTISPYSGIYAKNDVVNNKPNSLITVYVMLTGMKFPIEKIRALSEKAKEEKEAMSRKSKENKLDLSEFDTIGDDLFSSSDDPLNSLGEDEDNSDLFA